MPKINPKTRVKKPKGKRNNKNLKVVNKVSLYILLAINLLYLITILVMKLDHRKIGETIYEKIYSSYWYFEEALIIVAACLFIGILTGSKLNLMKYYLMLLILFVALIIYIKYFSNLSFA